MASIFLSHSAADSEAAGTVKKFLEELGYQSIFLDFDERDGIAGGSHWEQELYRNLRSSLVVIALASPNFTKSRWCFAEIISARQMGKAVILLQLDTGQSISEFPDIQSISFSEDRGNHFVRLRRAIERVGLLAKNDFVVDPARSPYPGLMYFEESDAAVYIGRDAEISDALDRVLAMARFRRTGILLIAGASGAGKSSLLRAGVVPRLRRNPEQWIVCGPMRPSNGAAALREVLRNSPPPGDTINVCCIDQFEEALDGGSSDRSAAFLELFAQASASTPSLIFVVMIRSDFMGLFQTHELVRDLDYQLMPIGLLPRERFPEVIERPASLYGIHFEPGLVQRIVAEAEHAEALPLVAFTLSQMWDKASASRIFTFTEYEGVGGIQGAVAAAARNVLLDLPDVGSTQQFLHSTFARLVDFGESGQLVRRRALWAEFPPSVRHGIERFVKSRLLISSGENGGIVEVAHEALFRIWADFSDWIETNRVFLLWRRRLHARMAEHAASQNEDSLPYGEVLNEALRFVKSCRSDLSADELEFVDVSARAADRRRERAELQNWRSQLKLRFEEWAALNRSENLLLTGPSLAQAVGRLTDPANDVSADERLYVEASEAHARQLDARRRFRAAARKWTRRAALASLVAVIIGVVLQQIWAYSDAGILHEIRTEAREWTKGGPAWFQVALAAGLDAEAKNVVSALDMDRRPFYLALLAKQESDGRAKELRAQALRDAAQGCSAVKLDSSGYTFTNPFRFFSVPANRLECLLRDAASIEAFDSPLAQDIRKLAREFWDVTRESSSKQKLWEVNLVIYFAHGVGADREAVDVWNQKVAPSIGAVLQNPRSAAPPECNGCVADVGLLMRSLPPGVEVRPTIDLFKSLPLRRNLSSVQWRFMEGLASTGHDRELIDLMRQIPIEDLGLIPLTVYDFLNPELTRSDYSFGQKPVSWSPDLLLRMHRVIEERLKIENDTNYRRKDRWRQWVRNQLIQTGSWQQAQSIKLSSPLSPAYSAEEIRLFARSFEGKSNFSQALAIVRDTPHSAVVIAKTIEDGDLDQALIAIRAEKLPMADRASLLGIAARRLKHLGRSVEARKVLEESEQGFTQVFQQNAWERSDDSCALLVECAKAFAGLGRVRLARNIAREVGSLRRPDYDYQPAVYLFIINACRSWHQRIGLMF